MFEIKVADVDVSAGSIPVSWCLDMETIAALSAAQVKDPQVVLITAPVDNYHVRKELRKVVPLKDLMAYVEFKAPGPNKIWAFISTKSAKDAKQSYLARRGGEYITDILNSEGDEWGYIFRYLERDENGEYLRDEDGRMVEVNSPEHSSALEVEVPGNVFAPEPAQWEKNWVNHFFKEKCVDQCDFRRRRLFAYTLQVVIILLQQFLRFGVTLLSAAILSRGFSLKPLRYPLAMDMDDMWSLLKGGSLFVRTLSEDKPEGELPSTTGGMLSYVLRKFYLVPFLPIVVIPVVLLALFKPMVLSVIGSITLIVLAASLIAVCILGGFASKVLDKIVVLFQGEPPPVWYHDQEEITLLTCNPEKKPLTLSALPPKKQSLKLRFLTLKSKVCRPFSA